MPTHKSYHSYLIQSLQDPAEAAAYLEAIFEDGDAEDILVALANVAEARQCNDSNVPVIAPDSNSTSQRLTQTDPSGLRLIASLLDDLGLKLAVTTK